MEISFNYDSEKKGLLPFRSNVFYCPRRLIIIEGKIKLNGNYLWLGENNGNRKEGCMIYIKRVIVHDL